MNRADIPSSPEVGVAYFSLLKARVTAFAALQIEEILSPFRQTLVCSQFLDNISDFNCVSIVHSLSINRVSPAAIHLGIKSPVNTLCFLSQLPKMKRPDVPVLHIEILLGL
ncbi:hypothetical protein F2P81_023892 [Scophthalmus maximus]|uniref:Uncharacterized protein n=1 Tax=Scophthalmus maximus TaxID=52904 RepID=A0A6A4RVZ3_SCOMX|nr:hypothetical protein F2P81_023892 [Scophthalmus maximus]